MPGLDELGECLLLLVAGIGKPDIAYVDIANHRSTGVAISIKLCLDPDCAVYRRVSG